MEHVHLGYWTVLFVQKKIIITITENNENYNHHQWWFCVADEMQ